MAIGLVVLINGCPQGPTNFAGILFLLFMKRFFNLIFPWLLRILGFASLALPVAWVSSRVATSGINGFLSVLLNGTNWISEKADSVIELFGNAIDHILLAVGGNSWFQLGAYICSFDVWLRLVASILTGAVTFFFYLGYGILLTLMSLTIAFAGYRIYKYLAKLLSTFGTPDGLNS